MKHLSDELLNRYIDNELDVQELNIVNEHIKSCEACLLRLKSLKAVDLNLKKIGHFKLSENFTDMVMKEIISSVPFKTYKPPKSYFLRFIFFILGLSIVSIVGLGLYEISLIPSSGENPGWINGTLNFITSGFSQYTSIFKNQTITLVGGVFTFILFVSVYFIYESHREIKNRINNLR
ncbi:MAG: anti-sigma factor family protein [Bacillota bacterium]